MSTFIRPRAVRVLAVLVLCLALLSTVGVAFARPGNGQGKTPPAPGGVAELPADHQPESDPKPGEAGYLAPGPIAEPPEGMTDEEFRAKDPAAYGQIVRKRVQLERELLGKVHDALGKAGISSPKDDPDRAIQVATTATFSPYGYMWFTLVPNSTSIYSRHGYLGTLYFIYGYYQPTVDSYKWYSVSWPALSGNNVPAYQSIVNTGPIPAYDWHVGFMYGGWRGFEYDGRDDFDPGKWRADPWTGGPYGRSCMEVHGGSGPHAFVATNGCIRLHESSIVALRSYYTYKMNNKYDYTNAILRVTY